MKCPAILITVITRAVNATAVAARAIIECIMGTNLCRKRGRNVVEKYIVSGAGVTVL